MSVDSIQERLCRSGNAFPWDLYAPPEVLHGSPSAVGDSGRAVLPHCDYGPGQI